MNAMMNSSLHKPYYDFFHFWKKKIICQMEDVKITSITSQKNFGKKIVIIHFWLLTREHKS